ncbi:sensor histidine kinase [Clostridium botulinum B str. Osaka05]|uniref:histidine kinase n=1 Tax=Clostridium botulinum B str. Osaka05 TaxID=1407017 RepID=A0A0S6TZL5_CLOBO|nr:HAMP domain-containing sensor histidine kinase [Clostridium botulinum]GAE00335.1 sensor histidine kinase [Clostridium botulinum B str. Osaka05]
MKKGLFAKFVATFTIIISVSFIIIAAFLSYWFESYYFDQRKNQLITESQFIGNAAVRYVEGNIPSEKINEVINYISNYLSVNIWITDKYGYVYAVSNTKHKNLVGVQVLTDELEELRRGNNLENKGQYKSAFSTPVHTFEVPIFYKGVFSGAIIMHTSIDEIKDPLKKVYNIIWISAIFAIIISCIVIYYFSQRIIIRPLAQINYVADKISKGEVGKRVDIESDDEIGDLASSFNSMAEAIEQVEINRRLFISNVSHEIRSPITSIKGFIGGILDGIVPAEKQDYYLKLTYEETQRLTRLINDLLDLSAIEEGHLKLNLEEIDLNEIIRTSVIKFETKIRDKKLKVNVSLEDDKVYVIADKDRLTQVVINVLDNAIKYANEGGNVKLNTKIKGSKVIVSIFNDGPVISDEDIKHIWDRFYKADKARSSKVSTGLGLSIVRSILTQHGEDIWVNNSPEGGVTFNFTIKRA